MKPGLFSRDMMRPGSTARRIRLLALAALLVGPTLSRAAAPPDLPPPPEVRLTLEAGEETDSSSLAWVDIGGGDAVDSDVTNEVEEGFSDPADAWSRPAPGAVVDEHLEAPTDDEHGAPRSSSNLLPLVLVGGAGVVLVGVLLLGFCGRRFENRFDE
jgi:hypothetical protein